MGWVLNLHEPLMLLSHLQCGAQRVTLKLTEISDACCFENFLSR